MGIINSLDVVWNKALAIIVVSFVFIWIFNNMEETKFKRWVSEQIEKFKEEFKDGG